MTKKPNITDEERQAFRDAMERGSGVGYRESGKASGVRNRESVSTHNESTHQKIKIPTPFQTHSVSGTDILSFSKPGVQHKKFSQLKRGKLEIEATLDLHEHTSDEAIDAVNDFFDRCQKNNIRTVCIIHGKGLFSAENKPILKNLLNQYLRQHPAVTAFHSAKNNRGGTGAVVVTMKAKGK